MSIVINVIVKTQITIHTSYGHGNKWFFWMKIDSANAQIVLLTINNWSPIVLEHTLYLSKPARTAFDKYMIFWRFLLTTRDDFPHWLVGPVYFVRTSLIGPCWQHPITTIESLELILGARALVSFQNQVNGTVTECGLGVWEVNPLASESIRMNQYLFCEKNTQATPKLCASSIVLFSGP